MGPSRIGLVLYGRGNNSKPITLVPFLTRGRLPNVPGQNWKDFICHRRQQRVTVRIPCGGHCRHRPRAGACAARTGQTPVRATCHDASERGTGRHDHPHNNRKLRATFRPARSACSRGIGKMRGRRWPTPQSHQHDLAICFCGTDPKTTAC